MGRTGAVLGFLVGAVLAAGGGVLAGLVAGAVVAGVGSRVVMKIVALAAGPDAHGALTANGNRVGDFTMDTLFLVAFGALLGAFGGLLYVALRRWLPGAGRGRGLLFGALLLGAFGTALLEADNVDFRRFGSAPLNVALFGALFPVFGVLVAPLADRAARLVPPIEGDRPRRLGAMAADVALLLGGVLCIADAALTTLEPLSIEPAPHTADRSGDITAGAPGEARWTIRPTRAGSVRHPDAPAPVHARADLRTCKRSRDALPADADEGARTRSVVRRRRTRASTTTHCSHTPISARSVTPNQRTGSPALTRAAWTPARPLNATSATSVRIASRRNVLPKAAALAPMPASMSSGVSTPQMIVWTVLAPRTSSATIGNGTASRARARNPSMRPLVRRNARLARAARQAPIQNGMISKSKTTSRGTSMGLVGA
jgi:hypothetical protein